VPEFHIVFWFHAIVIIICIRQMAPREFSLFSDSTITNLFVVSY